MKISVLPLFLLLLAVLYSDVFAQQGPANIRDADGATSLILWLRSDSGTSTTTNGTALSSWSDLSGYNHHAAQSTGVQQPTFYSTTHSLNGWPVIRFDGDLSSGGANGDRLMIDDSSDLDDTSGHTMFIVNRPTTLDGNPRGLVSKRFTSGGGGQNAYSVFYWASNRINVDISNNSRRATSTGFSANDAYITTTRFGNPNLGIFVNGTNYDNATNQTNDIINSAADLAIGHLKGNNSGFFAGDIVEVIIFREELNLAEKTLIENYLASRYNITISNNRYSHEATHPEDIFGIGQEPDGQVTENRSDRMIFRDPSSFSNGDYIMIGHDGEPATFTETGDIPAGTINSRLERVWRTSVTGNPGTITIEVDVTGYSLSGDETFRLLVNDSDSFEFGTSQFQGLVSGNTFTATNVSLEDGDYFTLGITTEAAPGQTYYSYRNGNWNAASTWTTDPSGTLIVDPAVPGPEDRAVILNGRTVTLTANVDTEDLQVRINEGGVLNMNGFEFTQQLVRFDGQGTFRVRDSYYPDADLDEFSSPNGGTFEYVGTANNRIPDNVSQLHNLRLNTSTADQVLTIREDLQLSGNLVINRGTFRVNDNASAVTLNLSILGDLIINNQGRIRVGTNNRRHQLFLSGDLLNNGGDVRFTNSGSPNYTSNPNQGTLDVNMISTNDAELVANGLTRFNRLIINKGNDPTFQVSARSNDPTNFQLYGRINEANGSTTGEFSPQNPEVRKALWIRNGTLELRNQIVIPTLTEGGNDFFIPENARLIIDGAEVASTASTAGNGGITIIGEFRIISGVFLGNNSAGIIYRDASTIFVEGGTVHVSQLRQSQVGEGDNFASYIQTGGLVIVDASGQNSETRARFSSNQPNNIFRMEGGTLRVQQGTNTGGIEILSTPDNVNVTGGTVEVIPQAGTDPFRINSTAPFYNLVIENGNRDVRLDNNLQVINDVTINNNGNDLNLNGNQLSIGRNFFLSDGAEINSNGGGLRFFGSENSELFVESTDYVLELNTFEVEKTSSTQEVVFASPRSDAWDESTDTWAQPNEVMMIVDGELRHIRGLLDNFDFTIDVNGDVIIGDRIGRDDVSRGRVHFTGSNEQIITVPPSPEGAQINFMQIFNSEGVRLQGGNMSILNGLLMREGIFDIGTRQLSLLFEQEIWIWSDPFSEDLMIRTAGNNSDGGVAKYFGGNTTHLYPIGVGSEYTPATVTLTDYSDSGIIRINPVNRELATLSPAAGDALQYYWRVRHQGFDDLPSVSYLFTYSQSAVDGNESNYVAGKVVGTTRSIDANLPATGVDISDNIITFDGGGTGSFTLEEASYTAAVEARFGGDVTIYYTRGIGDGAGRAWNNGNHWSIATNLNPAYDPHDSRQPAAGSFPQAGDIAVIGWVPYDDPSATGGMPHGIAVNNSVQFAEIQFSQMLDESGNPTARRYFRNFQFRPTVVVNPNGALSGDIIAGEGAFWLRSTGSNQVDPDFSTIDIGDFVAQDSSYVIYESTQNNFVYDNIPAEVPNMLISGNGWGSQNRDFEISTDITVRGNFELLGDVNLILSSGANGDFTVLRDLRLFMSNVNGNNSGGGASIRFPNDATRNISVSGNLSMINTGAVISVRNPNAPANTHTLTVEGNIIQNTGGGGGLTFFTSPTEDVIDLIFTGGNNQQFIRTSGNNPILNRIFVDKEQGTEIDIQTNFTLNGSPATADKPLVLTSGDLILNNSGIDITISSGGPGFSIPSSSSLHINQGTVRISGNDTGLLLDGLVRLSNDSALLIEGAGQNTFIEYSGSGKTILEIEDDAQLVVGSQVRRQLLSNAGILKYRQSGGTVTVGTQTAPQNNRGVLEVLNNGSEFSFTGGTFSITRGHNATSSSIAALFLEPEVFELFEGSVIQIGNDDTPASEEIEVTIQNAVQNFRVAAGEAVLRTRPLVLNEDLIVDSGTTFNANNLNVTIAGDLDIQGSLNNGTNTFTFNGIGVQEIDASGNLDFHDLVIDKSSGSVDINSGHDITVARDLQLLSGTLNDGGQTVFVSRNITNNGNHIGNGEIQLNGSSLQQINGAGEAVFRNLNINSVEGVLVNTNTRINGNLTLSNGVMNMGSRLLTLSADTDVLGTFGNNRMIQLSGALNDEGVRREFNSGSELFTFPIGSENKYRPVTYDIANNTSPGTITIKTVNIEHPSYSGEGDNRLRYYWIVNSTGFENLVATHTYTYDQDDVIGNESLYVPGRFVDGAWTPEEGFSGSTIPQGSVDTGNNTITIEDASFIRGEYTAAEADELGELVPYFSTSSGNWSDEVNWVVNDPVTGAPAPRAPLGNSVIIQEGHTITMDQDQAIAASVEINGVLDLEDTVGHIFSNITGTGEIIIRSDDIRFPAGNISEFLGSNGGTIRYDFPGDITLPSEVTTYNQLRLTGSGEKSLPATNLRVLADLRLDEGTLNLNNRTITVEGDFFNNTGNSNAITRSQEEVLGRIRMRSEQAQTIGGSTETRFCRLEVDNAVNVTINQNVFVDCNVIMTRGQMITNNRELILDTETATIINEAPGRDILGTVTLSARNVGFTSNNMGNIGFSIASGPDNIGNVTVVRTNQARTVFGSQSVQKVWDVSSGAAPSGGRNVSLTWLSSDDNGVDPVNAGVFRNSGSGWVGLGGNVTGRTITASTNSFSEWTIADESALPVEMEHFNVVSRDGFPLLEWVTATEYENYGYYLERSFLGYESGVADTTWTEIAFIEGQGTTSRRTEYSFEDRDIDQAGVYVYRIIQMDYDGRTETYGPLEFFYDAPERFELFHNYPNPFNPVTTIPYNVAREADVRIEVFDILGRRVQVLVNSTMAPGTYNVQFNGARYASGVYLIRMTADGQQHVRKMMLIK